jgi:hypothetical protein
MKGVRTREFGLFEFIRKLSNNAFRRHACLLKDLIVDFIVCNDLTVP